MAFDPSVEARALAAGLTLAGDDERAGRIGEAMAAGATASEILMALRWALVEFVRSDPPLPPHLRAAATRLETGLARLLGP